MRKHRTRDRPSTCRLQGVQALHGGKQDVPMQGFHWPAHDRSGANR